MVLVVLSEEADRKNNLVIYQSRKSITLYSVSCTRPFWFVFLKIHRICENEEKV